MNMNNLLVFSMTAAHNLFMNVVDRFSQLRSTVPTVRYEQSVTLILFTFILDDCIINAHALITVITSTEQRITDIATLKQHTVMQLVMEHMEYKQSHQTLWAINGNIDGCTKGMDQIHIDGSHYLFENIGKKCTLLALKPCQWPRAWGLYDVFMHRM